MQVDYNFIETVMKALDSCVAQNTRDAYGTPYTHYSFNEALVSKAKDLCVLVKENKYWFY